MVSYPAQVRQRFSKFLPPLAAFFVTLLVYGVTAVPDITIAFHSGDGGELITAVMTGGIPHPPGYPTYLLLGKLAAQLPVWPIAFRFNLFSAVCGAFAAAITSATGRLLGLSDWYSIMPGLMLAFIPLVWQQAVVTEVYTLNLVFISLFLWSVAGRRSTWLVGFLLGLSLTTHLTSILLLPLALLSVPKHQLSHLSVGFILGLTPFFGLSWLSRPDSPIVWGEPDSLAGWWWLVSAQIYQPNQLALPARKIMPRLLDWGSSWLRQLAFVGWALLPWSGQQTTNKKQWWGLVGTAVAYLVYAFFYNTSDAIVLTLPAWLLLSLSLAAAFKRLRSWGLVLPFALILLNFNQIDRVELHKTRPFAEQILSSSPPNAILITSGDPDIFALWYFHFVEEQRPDLIVVDDRLFAFDWYRTRLKALYPELQGLAVDDVPAFRSLNARQRPICTVVLVDADKLLASNSCVKEP